ncbi:MAG: DUF3280 domain-containing protein [Acetobacteraceae bacterium]
MLRILMNRRAMIGFGVSAAALVVTAAGAEAAPLRAAFMPFGFEDTSQPNPGAVPEPADLARLRKAKAEVERLLLRSGAYVRVDTAPIAHAIAENDLDGCDGCAAALAREIAAQVVVTGSVQKISDLILDMNVVIRDVGTGRVIEAGTAGFRGDNDHAWMRAADWLVRYRLLAHHTEK